MPLDLSFKDDQYEYTGLKETRIIARAIIINDKGEFAVHKLYGRDLLGDRNYYETPGGGVDEGETPEEAVVRECLEEVGYEVEVIEYLGKVEDYYNVLQRKNINHYYLCRTISTFKGTSFASKGDEHIEKTLFLPIDEIIKRYESTPDVMLSKIVKTRELPVWRYVKDYKNK